MTPNKVSVLALISGIIGAALFLAGKFYLGAVAYYVFWVLDCVDGKLARYSQTFDEVGGFYDFVIDRFVVSGMVFGMVVSFVQDETFELAIAAVGFVVMFLMKDVLDLKLREQIGHLLEKEDNSQKAVNLNKFTSRYKIHFKPGQGLSTFLVFIVGPFTGLYLWSFCLGAIFILFSIGANVVNPYIQYIRQRG